MFSGKYKQGSFCTDFDVDFVFVHFILKYAKQNEHVGGIATRNRKARLVNCVVFFCVEMLCSYVPRDDIIFSKNFLRKNCISYKNAISTNE